VVSPGSTQNGTADLDLPQMGDLASWLGDVHKTCVALLGPLDDEYGVEEVDDLLNLDPEDIEGARIPGH
jgi:hypothetical protein